MTVTIGGKAPTHVSANQTIQSAIDAAAPGDLIIVDPTCTTTGTTTASATCSAAALHAATPTQTASAAAHNEMLLMWKPVRLQGVGAASSIIDANAIPGGQAARSLAPACQLPVRLDAVRRAGRHRATGGNAGGRTIQPAPTVALTRRVGITSPLRPRSMFPRLTALPLEAVVGWDATLNGNLAEQLQEPSLMGAYEGAGITVLAQGRVDSHPERTPGLTAPRRARSRRMPCCCRMFPQTLTMKERRCGPQYSYCYDHTNWSTTTELVPNPYPSNYRVQSVVD